MPQEVAFQSMQQKITQLILADDIAEKRARMNSNIAKLLLKFR